MNNQAQEKIKALCAYAESQNQTFNENLRIKFWFKNKFPVQGREYNFYRINPKHVTEEDFKVSSDFYSIEIVRTSILTTREEKIEEFVFDETFYKKIEYLISR